LHKNDKNLSKNTSMTSDYGSNTVPLLTPDEIISIVKTDDLIANY